MAALTADKGVADIFGYRFRTLAYFFISPSTTACGTSAGLASPLIATPARATSGQDGGVIAERGHPLRRQIGGHRRAGLPLARRSSCRPGIEAAAQLGSTASAAIASSRPGVRGHEVLAIVHRLPGQEVVAAIRAARQQVEQPVFVEMVGWSLSPVAGLMLAAASRAS
jgi:hypothetical protein